ncbi:MAG TPA: hypothetical protein VK957_01630 [Lunatimonas sp.]|nr:hypothetical protein [Lunatimonas sp.]
MSIKQTFLLLLRYKYWIVLIPIAVAFLIFTLAKTLPQKFESSTIIFTNPTTNKGVNDGGAIRMDFYTSNNLFDNLTLLIKSRETVQSASLKLIALHLIQNEPNEAILSEKDFEELKIHIPDALKSALIVPDNLEQTFTSIVEHYRQFPDSPIEYLLREHPHYSIQHILNNLFVARKSSSDMMEVTFQADDAAICYYTLQFITGAFMDRYAQMKELENVNSIKYFEDQLLIAQTKLRVAESDLKIFMTENRILNYYEQGKYLDIAKLEHEQDEERSTQLMSGTKANLDKLEELFASFETRQSVIKNISRLQDEIVARNQQLLGLRLNRTTSLLSEEIEVEIREFQRQIEEESQKLFTSSMSFEGLQRREALDEWLRLKIQYEEQVQAIAVMQNRKEYLIEKIDEFAPLGAELKRLEREVDVNENQYLSILHGLNMAYLQKYDLEMTSPQKLIDEPFFPKKALPSKKLFLVVGGLMGSGFFVIGVVLLSFFIDPTIKTVKNAQKLTGLVVAGGWNNETFQRKGVQIEPLRRRLTNHIYNHLNQYINPDRGTNIIVFYSLKPQEGKSFLIQKMVDEILLRRKSVIYFGPSDTGNQVSLPCETHLYDPNKDLYEIENNNWTKRFSSNNHDFILVEMPDFQDYHLNYSLINQSHLLILVLDSEGTWTAANQTTLDILKQTIRIPHLALLNKLSEEETEEIIGEIPKKRSQLRKRIKNLLS